MRLCGKTSAQGACGVWRKSGGSLAGCWVSVVGISHKEGQRAGNENPTGLGVCGTSLATSAAHRKRRLGAQASARRPSSVVQESTGHAPPGGISASTPPVANWGPQQKTRRPPRGVWALVFSNKGVLDHLHMREVAGPLPTPPRLAFLVRSWPLCWLLYASPPFEATPGTPRGFGGVKWNWPISQAQAPRGRPK